MSKRKPTPIIRCQHYRWRLIQREGVYYADGRGNQPSLGKQSLGTRDPSEAQAALFQLDRQLAVKHGRAPRSILINEREVTLPIERGYEIFREHLNRPVNLGGVQESTKQRYEAPMKKFAEFCGREGICSWSDVNRQSLERYAAYLANQEYREKTIDFELTLLKQIVKMLIDNGHLGDRSPIQLKLKAPASATMYCWRTEEVQAMLQHCDSTPSVRWLHDLLLLLAHTGLRISEALSLRWEDLDFEKRLLRLTDESALPATARPRRRLKNGKSRLIPLHNNVLPMLQANCRTGKGAAKVLGREFVFAGPGGEPLDAHQVRATFVQEVVMPLADRFPPTGTGPSFRDGRFHTFRHYFCSTCANERVAERVLMSWLGHSSSKMVRHYYTLHEEESLRQMNAISFTGVSYGMSASGHKELETLQEGAVTKRVRSNP